MLGFVLHLCGSSLPQAISEGIQELNIFIDLVNQNKFFLFLNKANKIPNQVKLEFRTENRTKKQLEILDGIVHPGFFTQAQTLQRTCKNNTNASDTDIELIQTACQLAM